MICMSRRQRPQLARRRAPSRSVPVEADPARVGSSRRSTRAPSVVLPQPDSPTRPRVSPGAIVEADAVDGAHLRAASRRARRAEREAPWRARVTDSARSSAAASTARPAAPRGCAHSGGAPAATRGRRRARRSGGSPRQRSAALRAARRRSGSRAAARSRRAAARRSRQRRAPASPSAAAATPSSARGVGVRGAREQLVAPRLLDHAGRRT